MCEWEIVTNSPEPRDLRSEVPRVPDRSFLCASGNVTVMPAVTCPRDDRQCLTDTVNLLNVFALVGALHFAAEVSPAKFRPDQDVSRTAQHSR